MSIINDELKKLNNEQLILEALHLLLSEVYDIKTSRTIMKSGNSYSFAIRDEICERVTVMKDK